MAQCLRTFAALSGDLSFVLSTHNGPVTKSCNSSSLGSVFWPPVAPAWAHFKTFDWVFYLHSKPAQWHLFVSSHSGFSRVLPWSYRFSLSFVTSDDFGRHTRKCWLFFFFLHNSYFWLWASGLSAPQQWLHPQPLSQKKAFSGGCIQAQEKQVNIAEKTCFIYQQEEEPRKGNVLCVKHRRWLRESVHVPRKHTG